MRVTKKDTTRPDFWHHHMRARLAIDDLLAGTTGETPLDDKVAKAAADAHEALTKAALLRADQLKAFDDNHGGGVGRAALAHAGRSEHDN